MPKPIVRYYNAVPDIVVGTLIGAIVRRNETGRRTYINGVLDMKFTDKGVLIRIETANTIYVQVKS